MKNKKALDKIYSRIDQLIDGYADLSETKDADKKFWKYVGKNILQGNPYVKERELESLLYDIAEFNEKQGFMYGFNYALELVGKPDLLDNVIKSIEGEKNQTDNHLG